MKRKSIQLLFSFALCATLAVTLGASALAAGDVSAATESTWNSAKSQVQSVVNNVVFPVIDMILAILFFVKSALRISSTESMASLSLPRPVFCSPASSSH